jgi:uncharacterized protein (TIGR02246 family)
MPRTALFSIALALCAGSAGAQSGPDIQKLEDAFAAAFNKGDAAAIAAMYAENGLALPPGAALVKGRKAIQAFWAQAATQLGDMKLKVVAVTPLGPDTAREIGTLGLMTKTQPPQPLIGKYVVIWRKTGAQWLAETDIWNLDK